MFAVLYAVVLGYGFGYEGYDNGKYYLGVYTPSAEYGWIVTEKEIYLDTVFEKKNEY